MGWRVCVVDAVDVFGDEDGAGVEAEEGGGGGEVRVCVFWFGVKSYIP